MRGILVLSVALIMAAAAVAGEVPRYLVVPRAPTAFEERAAQELMFFYKAIYGRPLLRVPESRRNGAPAFFLGRTETASAAGIKTDNFGPEEWLVKTVGEGLVIAGGSPAGILYGVYQVLENLGVAFLAPDETVIPLPGKDFPVFNERGSPAFAGRVIRDGIPAVLRHDALPAGQWAEPQVLEAYRLWELRSRINGGSEKGIPLYYTGRINDIRHRPETGTMGLYVDPKLFDVRPSLFAADGEGFRGRHDVCMSNVETRRTALESLRRMIRQDRAGKNPREYPVVYDVSRTDGKAPYCRCEDCRRIAAYHGSDGGLLMDFVNSLARGIRREYPDVVLRTPQESVSGGLDLPGKILPEKNVLLSFSDGARSDIFRPVRQAASGRLLAFFMDWVPLGTPHVKLLRTRWNTGGEAFQPPRVESVFDTLRPDFRHYLDHGINALVISAETDNCSPQNFMMLNYFVASRLLVDPDGDPEALARLFIRGYYGEKASSVIGRYFRLIRRGVASDPLKPEGVSVGEWHFATPGFMLGFYRDLSRAAAEAELPRFSRRIRSELITPIWSVLVRWPRYEKVFTAAGITRERLLSECREYARSHVRRFPCDRPEKGDALFDEKFRSAEFLPVLPKSFLRVPEGDRRCAAFPFFRRDAENFCAVTADPESPQGRALKSAHPDPARHGVARIVPGREGLRTTAFSVTGGGGKTELVLTEVPQDEAYHWYRIPGRLVLDEHAGFSGHGGAIRCTLAHWFLPEAGTEANTWEQIWFSAKFTGPDYVKGSKMDNAVWVDAVVLLRR
ncbi:MAG: DUF4838 domain-containing protein [Lentisphaeria bacterium]|nr:DUF4838 domain-containing protein [Lentisphaeria bacterium]